jgi:hypothetical protein
MAVLVLGSAGEAVGPPATAPLAHADTPEYLAHPEGYIPRQGVPGVFLSIPKPIGAAEWEIYCKVLNASTEQKTLLAEAYDRYRRADWAFRLRNTQPLCERSYDLAARGSGDTDSALAAELVAIFKARDAVLAPLSQIEQRFFEETTSVLSEPQIALLQIVRMQRDRFCAQELGSPFPAFTFDIDTVLMQAQDAGLDITPRDAEMFKGLMSAWRVGATTLYQQHNTQLRKAVSEGLPLRSRAYEIAAQAGGPTPESAELVAQFEGKRRPAVDIARRIHDFHKQYVQLLAAELPTPIADALHRRFQEQAYRPFYPDACDLEPLFASVNLLGLSSHQQAAFDAIRAEYHAATNSLLTEMLDTYLRWRGATWTTLGYSFTKYTEYAEQMRHLSAQRTTKANAAIESVMAVLSGDQQAAANSDVAAARQRLEAFAANQRAVVTRFHGWPGPYD